MTEKKKPSAAAIVGAIIGLGLGVAMIYGIEKRAAAFDQCTARGVAYFKEIGAYPRLVASADAGRGAEEVARERCSRSLQAFP